MPVTLVRKFSVPIVSALLLGAADQASKVWAVRNLPIFELREIVPGFFGLVHVRNTGVAFSLLSNLDPGWVHPLLILATVLSMGAVLAYIAFLPCRGAAPVGLGLILGGAIGNLIDRARFGYVVDFLDLYWRNHHWPTFNVADVGITVGVILLLIDMVASPKEPARMHPVLLQIGSLKIYSYGVFVAIGFFAALWVSGREIARMGLDREKFLDMGFWVVLSAIAGARLFHVLVYWRQYVEAPWEILKLWNGGLVFYGGFIAATAACVVFLRRNRMPFLPVADASSLGIVLGLAFGRLGCTSAGCCFGKPTTLPWAITFTDPACLAPLHVPLHPTQIYEAIGSFAIFGFLYATRDRFKTPGMRFWTMLILYGAARAFFEIFRDDPRGFVGPFSESQVVSALLITYAVVSILRARSKTVPSAR